EMESPTFIHQWRELKSSDTFGVPEVVALLGEGLNHSFPYGDFCSYPQLDPATSFMTSSRELPTTEFERPAKQLKCDSWNSCTTENISTSGSSSSPQILSFGNPESPVDPKKIYRDFVSGVNYEEEDLSADIVTSQGAYIHHNHSPETIQGIKAVIAAAKSHSQTTQDHVTAERKRRERLTQSFIALSALVPGLKKMDKGSVLADAIKYLKVLKERVKMLEGQNAKKATVLPVVFANNSELSDAEKSSSNISDPSNKLLPEIEANVSDNNVLIRIHCKKHKGVFVKLVEQVEKLHLTVVNSSAIPFGNSALHITIMTQVTHMLLCSCIIQIFELILLTIIRYSKSLFQFCADGSRVPHDSEGSDEKSSVIIFSVRVKWMSLVIV
ncbi:hypothetical protein GIB67_041734, partial [Kingdonia uniflora]